MSQKPTKFQSKGKKFGGPRKPGGKGFGKSFEGDKRDGGKSRGFGASKGRGFGKKEGGFGRSERSFDDRKPRSFGDGERKPFKKRFDDDKPRGERSFGDRKPFKKRFDDDKPRGERSFGDRKPRSFGDGERKPFKKRFDDDKPRGGFRDRDSDRKSFSRDGERKPRSFGDGERKPFKKRERMDGTDRAFAAARSKGGHDEPAFARSPRKEKPFRSRDEGSTKPYQRSFDDRKSFGKKPFGKRDRDDRREQPRQYEPASSETRQKLKSDRPGYGAPSSAFLYGTHPVSAALNNPKRLMQRLLVTENGFENIREAYDEAVAAGIKVPEPTYVEKEDIDRLLPREAVHQDVLLDSQPPEEVFLADLLVSAPEDAKIVILDQVTDPHNVGAIMRSAVAFGAIGVVAQKLNAPEITGTLAKSASGAAEHIPLVRETNLSRAIEQLQEAGFTCIGLDERGRQTIAEFAPKGKVAIVMGAEGDGLRRLVGEKCDVLLRLPTSGPIASLNVSNAAAVALYELVRNDK